MRMSKRQPKDPLDIRHGKEFEKEVHEAFRPLYLKYPIRWERVLDTYDAGSMVRKADCDFKITVNSGIMGRPWVINIECKASRKHTSLQDGGALRSLIKSDQIATMRIALRSGVLGQYWFKSVETGRIEIWKAEDVIRGWGMKNTRGPRLESEPWILKVQDLPKFGHTFVQGVLEQNP